jgi:outer membrane protein OmpA-like peptidoglycan-associated protein
MRLSLFFLMVILLPVAAVAHAYYIAFHRLPLLRQEVLDILGRAEVQSPKVDLAFLDIDIAGEAPSPEAHRQVVESIRRIGPLRLKPGADRLHVNASVKSSLHDKRLRLTGWLPERKDVQKLQTILSELRPDLTIDITDLQHAPEVRWPADFKPPLDAANPFLGPILDHLRIPAELKVEFVDGTLRLTGMLPAGGIKEEIIAALSGDSDASEIDPSALRASPHVKAAPFAKKKALAAFLASFFAAPPPRSFEIKDQGRPRLTGIATRKLESEWLTLLRPVTGAAQVDSQLVLLPSLYHQPGYQPKSPLAPAIIEQLRDVLQGMTISFESGTSIPPLDQTKLAALAPSLLAAGPALGLIIGGHPDPLGDTAREHAMAKDRAEAVLSFLIEQGVPSADITAVAFEPVPPGSSAAPAVPRSVEILVK